MKQVKFIHAADLHLDSPMIGLMSLPPSIFSRLKESTFVALENLVDKAIEEEVDFVILSGDLFDSEDRSIKAQTKLRNELGRLKPYNIPVFAVHGNHDHLEGSWSHLKLPDNVHVFSTDVEKKLFQSTSGINVHLYGFSYSSRHVMDRKIDLYQKEGNVDFHIGILHGNMDGNQEHGNYAPFSLKDLLEKDFDYWALGHIHKRMIISQDPPVIYSGNTQGRNRKETGMKGAYLVTLNAGETNFEFFPTSDCIWDEIEIDVTGTVGFEALYIFCKNRLEAERDSNRAKLISIKLQRYATENNLRGNDIISDLLEALQEDEKEEVSFVWPFTITVQEQHPWDRETLAKQTDFYGELFRLTEEMEEFEKSLSTLYQHPQIRKFITPITNEEKKEMLQFAENYLVEKLLKE